MDGALLSTEKPPVAFLLMLLCVAKQGAYVFVVKMWGELRDVFATLMYAARLVNADHGVVQDRDRGARLISRAMDDLHRRAIARDPRATHQLAAFTYCHDLVNTSATADFMWWTACAVMGNAEAQNSLGRAHEISNGCHPDSLLAFNWFKASADQRLAKGAYNLARYYEVL